MRADVTVRYAGRPCTGTSSPSARAPPAGPARRCWAAAARSARCLGGPGSARGAAARRRAALMPLAGPGMLATAVGADIRQVRAALDPL